MYNVTTVLPRIKPSLKFTKIKTDISNNYKCVSNTTERDGNFPAMLETSYGLADFDLKKVRMKIKVHEKEQNDSFPSKKYKFIRKKNVLSGSDEMYNRYNKLRFNTKEYLNIFHQNFRKDFKGSVDISNAYLKTLYDKSSKKKCIVNKNDSNLGKVQSVKGITQQQTQKLDTIGQIRQYTIQANSNLLYPMRILDINDNI